METNSSEVDKRRRDALALVQRGEFKTAIALLDQLCSTCPDDVELWFAHGVASGQTSDFRGAERCFREILKRNAQSIDASYNLALALQKQGRLSEAIACYRAILKDHPEAPIVYNNIGVIYGEQGQYMEARQALERAVELDKTYLEAILNLANLHRAHHAEALAIDFYKRAAALARDNVEILLMLGDLYTRQSQPEQSLHFYKRAHELAPKSYLPAMKLAQSYRALQKFSDAEAIFRVAISIQPTNPDAWSELMAMMIAQDRFDESIKLGNEALTFSPKDTVTLNNLAVCHLQCGDPERALANYEKATFLDPGVRHFEGGYLLTLNYTQRSCEEIFKEHCSRAKLLTGGESPRFGSHTRNPHSKLRVGYLSRDFRYHPVGFFIKPILHNHDKDSFEVFAYSDVREPDRFTEDLESSVENWRDVSQMSRRELAMLIKNDNIDLLVDLTSYAGSSYADTLAQRPAPVQISYLGYPATTGLECVDFRVTDAFADPPGSERFYTEELYRLPHGFHCYQPMKNSPAIAPLRALSDDQIVFASFNNAAKISPSVIQTWANILKGTDGSKLLLKYRGFRAESTRRRFVELFAAHGIESSRLQFEGWARTWFDHMQLYNTVHVALDTFPYNGTTTTCEALWMGVPIITLEGQCHAGRVGVSLLSQIGMQDLIAGDLGEYIAKAIHLAQNTSQLSWLRNQLRDRMRNSPLCDCQNFTHQLEIAYKNMWSRSCEKLKT